MVSGVLVVVVALLPLHCGGGGHAPPRRCGSGDAPAPATVVTVVVTLLAVTLLIVALPVHHLCHGCW